MFPNQQIRKSLKKQKGSMLVIALFVIIVLAFLAYAMIGITENSNRATVYEVYGARALHAANSGTDRALNEILGPNKSESCDNASSNYALGSSNSTTTGASFSGCNIVISCDEFLVTETGFTHFRVQSTASCIASEFTTYRSVSVEARVIKN